MKFKKSILLKLISEELLEAIKEQRQRRGMEFEPNLAPTFRSRRRRRARPRRRQRPRQIPFQRQRRGRIQPPDQDTQQVAPSAQQEPPIARQRLRNRQSVPSDSDRPITQADIERSQRNAERAAAKRAARNKEAKKRFADLDAQIDNYCRNNRCPYELRRGMKEIPPAAASKAKFDKNIGAIDKALKTKTNPYDLMSDKELLLKEKQFQEFYQDFNNPEDEEAYGQGDIGEVMSHLRMVRTELARRALNPDYQRYSELVKKVMKQRFENADRETRIAYQKAADAATGLFASVATYGSTNFTNPWTGKKFTDADAQDVASVAQDASSDTDDIQDPLVRMAAKAIPASQFKQRGGDDGRDKSDRKIRGRVDPSDIPLRSRVATADFPIQQDNLKDMLAKAKAMKSSVGSVALSKGDTISKVAREQGYSTRELLDFNNITDEEAYKLPVGFQVKLPPKESVKESKGDIMKFTEKYLEKIIKEELKNIVNEQAQVNPEVLKREQELKKRAIAIFKDLKSAGLPREKAKAAAMAAFRTGQKMSIDGKTGIEAAMTKIQSDAQLAHIKGGQGQQAPAQQSQQPPRKASMLRAKLRKMVAAGKSDQEVKQAWADAGGPNSGVRLPVVASMLRNRKK